jgi:Ca-activated chloride channel family protein
MPDVFSFAAVPELATLPAEAATELKILIKLQSLPGLVVPTAAKAMTTNICLVFDCSGSMAGQKREAAIEAAKVIVDTVHERHRLSLVGFSTRARVLVDNAQPNKEGKEKVKKKIDAQIRAFPRGTTNLAYGLKKAKEVLGKHRADAKVMVILSDGGADHEKKAQAAGLAATAERIQLFAVGIGEDYDADSLQKLVTPSNGAMFGESDLDRIKATFEMLIGRIEAIVATNAALSVTLAEQVRAGKAYKVSPDQAVLGALAPEAKATVRLSLGNMEREVPYAYLVALTAAPRAPGRRPIAKVTFSFDAPAFKLRDQKLEREVVVEWSKGGAGEANAEVRDAFLRLEFLELAEALASAQRRGDLAGSAEALEKLMRRAEALGDGEARAFYQDVLDELNERGKIAQARLNAVVLGVVGALRKKKAPAQYDVVLVEPGTQPIVLVRELRRITGLELKQVGDLVRQAPKTVQVLPLAEARALKKELQGYGAKVEVKPVRIG